MELEPMSDKSSEVHALIKKATEAQDSGEAMRFSQAACNAANALVALSKIRPS